MVSRPCAGRQGKGLDLARRKCLLEHMKAALLILLFGSPLEYIAQQVVH